MITLYFAPRTLSVRIRWLLEELGLPYDLRRVTFKVPEKVFSQDTPLGKFPVIEDGEVTICESGRSSSRQRTLTTTSASAASEAPRLPTMAAK